MLVDEMERAEVAILDAALSADRIRQQAESGIVPAAAEAEPSIHRFSAARGAVSGVFLGVTLWAAILAPVFRR